MSDSNHFIKQSNFSKLGSNILSETSHLTVLLFNFIYDRAYFKYATFISSFQHDLPQLSGEEMHFTTNQVVMFTDLLPSQLASVFCLSDKIYVKLFWICEENRANFFPSLQRIPNNVPNSSHFNVAPSVAVAPTTTETTSNGPSQDIEELLNYSLTTLKLPVPPHWPIWTTRAINIHFFLHTQLAVSCPDAVVRDSLHANSEQHTREDCLLRKRPFILPQEAEFGLIVKLSDKSVKAVFWCRVVCGPLYNRNGKGKKKKNMHSVYAWRVFSTSSHLLWLKVCILTPWCVYFCRIFLVSSSVLKEFMRTRGTSVLYVLFRCCRKKDACCGQRAKETYKKADTGRTIRLKLRGKVKSVLIFFLVNLNPVLLLMLMTANAMLMVRYPYELEFGAKNCVTFEQTAFQLWVGEARQMRYCCC